MYIPAYKILFGISDDLPFSEYNFEWISLAIWIYMALIYEISFNFGLNYAFRKGKYSAFKAADDYLSILKGIKPNFEDTHRVCRICYQYFEG